MLTNLGIIAWLPVAAMILAMLVWGLLVWGFGKNAKAKAFISKHSVFGWGCFVISVITAIFLITKSLLSPMIRPITEVAPKMERPIVVESVEPTELKDLTKLAKPKDVLKEQPDTPLVDKAVKRAQEKQ